MLRKILSFFFALFVFLPTARSAEMVNVEYIHQYLNARWGIDLPYNPALENPKVAANMEYLLTVVDIANEYLNGEKTTSYGTGEYATKLAADTIATNTAIDTLVRAPTFYITTTPDTTSFSITIGAAGDFTIDWGDGKRETIRGKEVGATIYSHTYSDAGEYIINISGRATDYGYSATDPAVSFYTSNSEQKISKISGDLGKLFPTLSDGSQPGFFQTFYRAENLTEISANLFDGIHGQPVEHMFDRTFSESGITSIPANLFGELNGDGALSAFSSTFFGCEELQTIGAPLFSGTLAPAAYMFSGMFYKSGVTNVPANLFGKLNGDGAPYMFYQAFSGCKQLQTVEGPLFSGTLTPAESMFYRMFAESGLVSIPADLFAGVRGAPAVGMFSATFSYCNSLQSIPDGLFAGISGPAANEMFYYTFASCTSLAGPSARIDGQYLYEIWPDVDYLGTYNLARGLADYAQIPSSWK